MNDPAEFLNEFGHRCQIRAKLNVSNKSAFFDALAGADITEVHVAFDSEDLGGQIESIIAFHGEVRADLPVMTVPFECLGWAGPEPITTEWSLEDAIETLCFDYLGDIHRGWEDDEGGYGEFRFNVSDRTLSLEFNERYTDIHTSNHRF